MKNNSRVIPMFIFICIVPISFYWFSLVEQSNIDNNNNNNNNNNKIKNLKTINKQTTLDKLVNSVKQIANNGVTEPSPPPPLVQSARKQIGVTVTYNPEYVKLKYPMGDVDQSKGVCTDVVIRAYRLQGKDLQELVHKDMKKAWQQYPKIWGLKKPDPNIDHRRVPNLRVFFTRHGKSLTVSKKATSYKAGDIVTWKIQGRPHIGIVSSKITSDGVPLIIHNIGRGTQENDILFKYPITGHYRY